MIFSIIMGLTDGLTQNESKLSLMYAPFVLGLISGGAIIYWFTPRLDASGDHRCLPRS